MNSRHNMQMAASRVRCLTWNISGAVLDGGTGPAADMAGAADYVVRCVAGLHPEIVALQEVPFLEPENEFIDGIAQKAGFPYTHYFAVSPSHLHENARLGIAVLSRFPLSDARRVDLPNPNLIIHLPDGRRQKTHDKAMLIAKVAHPEGEFHFICAHLPPFAEFNRRPGEPMFRELRAVMRDAIRPLGPEPVLFAGDINSESLKQLVPELLEQDGFFELIYRVTKCDREICDQIACSPHWTNASALVVPSKSDHAICVADLSLGKPAEAPASVEEGQQPRATILHLSDLHLGPGTQEDVDWKQYLEEAERSTRAEGLERYLRSLPAPPHYVVISGDFTIGGRPEGFQKCREILNRLIDDEVLPPADRIIVVPGNHDVTRKVDGRFAQGEERWAGFKSLGENFVRPWLPGDPAPSEVLRQFRKQIDAAKPIWGGVEVESNERTRTQVFRHFPVLFDRKKQVLFYLFNSASVSGTRIRIDEKTARVMDANQAVRLQDAEALNTLIAEIERLRDVDAARVNPDEVYLFQDIMSAIRNAAGEEFQRATKIAVLHHHIAPIYTEEVKQFELLLNAGQFKKNIVSQGFRLVLHGHKHWPEIFADTAISGAKAARLSVVSGGTIGGWSTQPPGFYWLELRDEERVAAAYIPLKDEAPRLVIDAAPRSEIRLSAESPAAAPEQHRVRGDLRKLYDDCERSMMKLVQRQNVQVNGVVHRDVGWNNFLGAAHVTPFGTGYGLHVMKFLNADSSEYRKVRQEICETLLRMRRNNLGWSASSLGEPGQPIETAVVLSSMARVIPEDEVQLGVERLVAQIDDGANSAFLDSTTGVCVLAQALADLAPQSPMLARLVDLLIHAVRTDERGRYLGWEERTFAQPDRAAADDSGGPSAPHTAQVIATLRRVHRQTEGRLGLAADDLSAAAEWLIRTEWRNAAETVEECEGKRLALNHYTAPMAVLALLLCDYSPATPKIAATVEELWHRNEQGLWWYEQVRWPVWATLSCLQALTEFTFRSAPVWL